MQSLATLIHDIVDFLLPLSAFKQMAQMAKELDQCNDHYSEIYFAHNQRTFTNSS